MKALLPKIIIPLVALLLGVGGAVAATMFLDLPFLPAKGAAATDKTATVAKATPAKPVVPAPGDMYPLRERIVNLADTGGALRYLKTSMVLEVVPEKPGGGGGAAEDPKKKLAALQAAMADFTPVIEDTVNVILTAKTSTELMTPDGKVKLKEEIKSKVNKALHDDKVLNVYLTDFIIQ